MITSRSRYAIKIMLDLAHNEQGPLQKRLDIARRQGIPSDYMDHILVSLRARGLVCSMRGRIGGVELAKPAKDISVWDILAAVETNLHPVVCLDPAETPCILDSFCVSQHAWSVIFDKMRGALDNLMLSDLLGDRFESELGWDSQIAKIQECRSPRK